MLGGGSLQIRCQIWKGEIWESLLKVDKNWYYFKVDFTDGNELFTKFDLYLQKDTNFNECAIFEDHAILLSEGKVVLIEND